MQRIVDLTMPVADHFRWSVERRLKGDFAKGDEFQITWIGWTVHGFTHVDSPRHMVPGGTTTSDITLEQIVGDAAVVDLTAVKPDTAIDAATIERAGGHIRKGDIVLLKTGWDRVESANTPEFWTRAPYMTREACEWLLARGIRAIGFDFPQDYPIRGLLTGAKAPMREFVTHDVLLRAGVIMIEYLCNMSAIKGPRTQFIALPLEIPDSDGAPARVIALEPA
jgi:kynurenine formamidase